MDTWTSSTVFLRWGGEQALGIKTKIWVWGFGFFLFAIFPLVDRVLNKAVISRVTVSNCLFVLGNLFWDGKHSPNPEGTLNMPVFI